MMTSSKCNNIRHCKPANITSLTARSPAQHQSAAFYFTMLTWNQHRLANACDWIPCPSLAVHHHGPDAGLAPCHRHPHSPSPTVSRARLQWNEDNLQDWQIQFCLSIVLAEVSPPVITSNIKGTFKLVWHAPWQADFGICTNKTGMDFS